jgi:phosphoribosylformylglycinamidine synthase
VTAGLFAETPGRVVVAIKPGDVAAVTALATKHGIAFHNVGSTGGDALTINGAAIPLTELRAAFTETFPKLFG